MTAAADLLAAPRQARLDLTSVQTTGLLLLTLLVLAVSVGPALTPYEAGEIACTPFERPSGQHPLGCNDVGQDLLTGVLAGGRISLAVGLVTALIATLIATLVAIGSAWRGGFADIITMRLVDAVMALPFLPLVVVLSAFFGASFTVQIGILCLVLWTQPVRELRAQALNLRRADYTDAARAMGGSGWHIATRHILPELTPLIVPQFVRIAHAAILTESALSFLGLGDPTAKSWGTILFHANARTAFLTDAWLWWILPPGLLIALSVLALALAGHGIGDRREDGTLPSTKRDGLAAARKTDAQFEAAGLSMAYGTRPALRNLSLDVLKGETLGLIGESGSGKSTVAMTALRLLPPAAQISSGSIWVGAADLLGVPPAAMRHIRGRRVALVPQAAMNALDPVRSVGWQIAEAVRVHGWSKQAAQARAAELMGLVELPVDRLGAYPHELSGGMRQRVAIAIALAAEPEVLIADEPTTGLDVLVQKNILDLIDALAARLDLTVLFISHDLPMIARRADRLTILQDGRVVETGRPADLAARRSHPHTAALFDAILPLTDDKRWQRPKPTGAPVVVVEDLSVIFNAGLAGRLRGAPVITALNDVSLKLHAGEVLGLVGGSGSGKTTLARCIAGLTSPTAGQVSVFGGAPRRGGLAAMIFQDPYQSMRAAMRVGDVVAEPLRIAGQSSVSAQAAVREALNSVGLPGDVGFLDRRLGSLSGGQRQRVAVARAIVPRPHILVADEPTSMLDQSLRADLLDLFEGLRADLGLAILFITHDLALARHFCDRIAVMRAGETVETGSADAIVRAPKHAYTHALIEAAAS
ncbi:MAG: ATP-binding cassette domain-containing protein [Pseudomonadota bacterium]